MKKLDWLALLALILLLFGCQRGDVSISPVIEGQTAPHAGWNIGPDMWVEPGDTVRLTGVVVRVEGLDPNDLFK